MELRRKRVILAGVAFLCCVPAHAYIDPGTGSALIQGLIAATAAVGITLKLYWHRIVAFIGRRKSKESRSTSEALGHRESHKPT